VDGEVRVRVTVRFRVRVSSKKIVVDGEVRVRVTVRVGVSSKPDSYINPTSYL
jgi:hypothetical protein